MTWSVERFIGAASDFHAHAIPDGGALGRQAWVFAVERPALVLGSTQPEAAVVIIGVGLVAR